MHTEVGIIGAGPAGLLLALMLQRRGIGAVVVEARSRETIEATIRAGILEQSTVDLMRELGVSERLAREGVTHHGTILRFGGRNHRIDFGELTDGRVATLYPQHEVLRDLIEAVLARGIEILFEHRVVDIEGLEAAQVSLTVEAPGGATRSVTCEAVVGADGFHGAARQAMPRPVRREYQRVYPFGWFGILCEAPPSSEELIYARHERGFALISSRTPTVQRMYFQCDPAAAAEHWSETAIWAELQARVAGPDGFRLREGRIFQRNVVAMRSFVCEPMQHGRLLLAGDAAHTVPPTGAKGLNLAVSDVWHADQALGAFFATGDMAALEGYTEAALRRVWRAQHFSWWMTSMLHRFEEASAFDDRRQQAELELVTGNRAAATALAQNYVGLPLGQ